MKQTILVFIVILVLAGAGFYAYRQHKAGTSMTEAPTPSMQQGGTTSNGNTFPTTNPMPSPIPTVSQITLTVTSPSDKSTVTVPNTIVKGNTIAGADVFVNDTEVTADSQGNFSTPFTLDEGDNVISVTANDATGNYAERDLTVTYTPTQ